jgi:hypothetical protein
MGFLKTVSLTTGIAAVALMSVGTAPAVATEGVILCKANQTPCAPANRYPVPMQLEAKLKEATTARFELGGSTIECSESSWSGETTTDGTPLLGKITSMKYGGCMLGATKCTVTPINLPYKTEFSATEGGNGTMAMKSGGAGEPGVAAECGFSLKCNFTKEPSLPFTGGKPASIAAKEVTMNRSGTVCPKEARWTSTYVVVNPNGNVSMSRGKTSLCNSNELTCAAGNTYAKETPVEASLEAGTKAVFAREVLTVECTGASMEAKTMEESNQPLALEMGEFFASGCNNSCSIAMATGAVGKLRATGSGNGTLTLEPIVIWTLCPVECVYRKASAILDVIGGNPAKVKAVAEPLSRENPPSEPLCSENLTWTATYSVSSPKPMYLTG